MIYLVLASVVVFVPSMSYLLVRLAWSVRKKDLIKMRDEIIELGTDDAELNRCLEEIKDLLENEFRDFAFIKKKYNLIKNKDD